MPTWYAELNFPEFLFHLCFWLACATSNVLIFHLYILLDKIAFQALCPFVRLFVFLLLRFESSLYIFYIFWVQMFSWIYDLQIFSPICSLLFYSLSGIFHCVLTGKSLIVMKFNLIFFSFMDCSLEIISGNS